MFSKSLFVLILIASIFQGCSSHFFHPDQVLYRTPEYYDLKYDEAYFSSKDKTSLHAWHIYPRAESKGLLFVAHGNAQNLSSHFVSWVWLLEEGYEIFIFDYRGYGKSQGKAGIKGSIEDTKAALDYLQERYKKDYFVFGKSFGGTILLDALEDRDNAKIKAVIIDSTFTGFSDIASEKMANIFFTWPFQWIPYLSLSDKFDAKDRVTQIDKPLLFLHGSLDPVIPANHSWQLFELSNPPREIWIVKKAEHTQALENRTAQKDFLEFLESGRDYYEQNLSRMKIYE